jgi:hypothetical protein
MNTTNTATTATTAAKSFKSEAAATKLGYRQNEEVGD